LAELYNFLGVTLAQTGPHDEAVVSYREAIRLQPGFAQAYSNLGLTLLNHGDVPEAIEVLREALRLAPDMADACTNLGLELLRMGETESVLTYLRDAIRLRPTDPRGYGNLGNVLMDLARYEEARGPFEEALRLAPEDGAAHRQMAGLLLTLGEWERGWEEYEHRWGSKELKPRAFRQPQWGGEPLHGRTVLVHVEQGIGDTIQFVRYTRFVRERGGRAILECVPELADLMRRCPAVDELFISGGPRPPFDLHCPLLSLPRVMGLRVDTVPAECPYLFPEPDRLRRWRDELAGIGGLKIAINWQGNPKFVKDRMRSVPLRAFRPLADVPGVRLLSVQKFHGADQLASIRDLFPVLDVGARLDLDGHSFLDTAALLCAVDLVITSDTSLPHLAGALGRPVWLVVGHSSEWRWLRDREDSPWYPTMRLFRQRKPGDWDETFARIATALREYPSTAARSLRAEVSTGVALEGSPGPFANPAMEAIAGELRELAAREREAEARLRSAHLTEGPAALPALAREVVVLQDRRRQLRRQADQRFGGRWVEPNATDHREDRR
jgi:Flp pilus assembly protein TadD